MNTPAINTIQLAISRANKRQKQIRGDYYLAFSEELARLGYQADDEILKRAQLLEPKLLVYGSNLKFGGE